MTRNLKIIITIGIVLIGIVIGITSTGLNYKIYKFVDHKILGLVSRVKTCAEKEGTEGLQALIKTGRCVPVSEEEFYQKPDRNPCAVCINGCDICPAGCEECLIGIEKKEKDPSMKWYYNPDNFNGTNRQVEIETDTLK